jgi:tRNA pseudouridine55 synthase
VSKPRIERRVVDGWLILDKPTGMTSTHAVSRLKRIFSAKKAGHAGTLDPLASGILPVAFGEATKTVPFVQDGEKAYRFTVRWGVETDSDDSDGAVTRTSDNRPTRAEVEAALPSFIGEIMQRPPSYSAIKVNGERAYDLARDGELVQLPERPVFIDALRIVAADADSVTLEAECGKGTYVRSIARDLGQMLGCFGHVTALRRTRVGPFFEEDAVTLEDLGESAETAAQCLDPVEAGLSELPCIVIDRNGAARLRRGQSLLLRGKAAPGEGEECYVVCDGAPVAFGQVRSGEFVSSRVFNFAS